MSDDDMGKEEDVCTECGGPLPVFRYVNGNEILCGKCGLERVESKGVVYAADEA